MQDLAVTREAAFDHQNLSSDRCRLGKKMILRIVMKEAGMRDSNEKEAGMWDQNPPFPDSLLSLAQSDKDSQVT